MTTLPSPPDSSTPRPFVWTLVCLIFLALWPTVWTHLDLKAAAIFSGTDVVLRAVEWPWVEWINAWIPAVFRTVLILCLLAWGMTWLFPKYREWRFALAFVVVAGTLGPGLLVNLGFKDNWQRARPYQVEPFGGTKQFTRAAVMTDQCDNNCSFVSGHVACGYFLVGMALVHRRRQLLWTAAGVASGLAIGFARMADSAHWLSDVLWAGPITLTCSWTVWRAMLWLGARNSGN
ncbi:MAG: phosphatase PAP2 family protein [Rhodoferax sp.]|nr:phosphatase PAP2 family protein [Rhodoferax sp.]